MRWFASDTAYFDIYIYIYMYLYSWKPPLGHPNLEVFLSQVESELFIETQDSLRYFNLSQEEWRAVRSLADDRSIVIKKVDKGSCVVVWDR